MKVSWSDQALEALRDRFGTDSIVLKLAYDTEGCGCAVNGVAALWAVDAPPPGDARADSEPVHVWYDKQHAIFFDEELRVGYRPEHRTFSLASDGQIYSNRLTVQDRRNRTSPIQN